MSNVNEGRAQQRAIEILKLIYRATDAKGKQQIISQVARADKMSADKAKQTLEAQS